MYAGIDGPLREIYGIGADLFGRAHNFLHFPVCDQDVPESLAIRAFGRLIHLQHRIKGACTLFHQASRVCIRRLIADFNGIRYFRRRVRLDITLLQKQICGAGALLDYGLTPTFVAGL